MRAATAALRSISNSSAWPLLAVSCAAWIGLLSLTSLPTGAVLAICKSRPAGEMAASSTEPRTALLEWGLMFCAMTPPLLWHPLRHVSARSLASRRARATALYLLSYALVWLGALLSVTLAARTLLPLAAIGVVLVWQGSAAKRKALQRCHVLPVLPVFGQSAELASLRFGLVSGWWCAASCWGLMLAALSAPALQGFAMMTASLLSIDERYGGMAPSRTRPALLSCGVACMIMAPA